MAREEVSTRFGDRVRVTGVEVFLPKDITYSKIIKKELSVREGFPRGSFHLYLQTPKGRKRVSVRLSLLWACDVLVFGEDLSRGERVYPWMIEKRKEYMNRCPRQSIDTDEVINYITLRNVRRGDLVKKSYLKRDHLVKRGDEVEIVIRSGAIELIVQGEALENGFMGDTIRVKREGSGKVLRGRVVSEGKVVVK